LFIAIFGYLFKASGEKQGEARPIAVWNGAGPAGEPLIQGLAGSKLFTVVPAASADAVKASVLHHDQPVGLAIPANFDPAHGHPPTLWIDPGESPQTAGPLRGAVIGVLTRAAAGGEPPQVVDVQHLDSHGSGDPLDELTSPFQLTVPGNAVLFGFFIAL